MVKVYLGMGAMIPVRGSRASSEWHCSFRNRIGFRDYLHEKGVLLIWGTIVERRLRRLNS